MIEHVTTAPLTQVSDRSESKGASQKYEIPKPLLTMTKYCRISASDHKILLE